MNITSNENTFTENVAVYFTDIKNSKGLSREAEAELGEKILNGDRDAINTLVTANLKFVVQVAKYYRNRGLEFEDLIAYGNLGLIKAAERYDYRQGYKFISYGVWYIKQAIMEAINKENESREESLESMVLSNINVKDDTGLVEERDEWLSYGDEINSLQSSDKSEQVKMVNKFLSVLDEKEQDVIQDVFGLRGEEVSLTDLSKKYNVSVERMKQIRNKAIRKMRASYISDID